MSGQVDLARPLSVSTSSMALQISSLAFSLVCLQSPISTLNNTMKMCNPTLTPIPAKKKASLSQEENLLTVANAIVNEQLVTRLGSDSLDPQLLRAVPQLKHLKT